jgi:ribosomal protein S18 acetylase RimI-like enzyme
MKRATIKDKEIVINTLYESFKDNKSVQYIAGKKEKNIKYLMYYSFINCLRSGEVFISDSGDACALIQNQDKKNLSLWNIFQDIKLIFNSIGFTNISKTLRRERIIKSNYPTTPYSYLWFIGVHPKMQGQGSGSKLLNEVFKHCETFGGPILLETSTEKNIPWYVKNGFQIYATTYSFGFPFYFLKKN